MLVVSARCRDAILRVSLLKRLSQMLVVSACCRDAILRVSLLKKLRSFQFARPTDSY